MITRRQAVLLCAASVQSFAGKKEGSSEEIEVRRVPDGGLQPQVALDQGGRLHLVYYQGDARQGDIFYVSSKDAGKTYSAPLRVNSHPGSAVAAGTIRGAQLALGRDGQVHIAWNGSMAAEPKGPVNPDAGKPGMPMLYARLNDSRTAFEPQRNLMNRSFGLDGGGSVAADAAGDVYVAWHGIGLDEGSGSGKEGEARRQVWLVRSTDDGRTFLPEAKAWGEKTGACGCCGMKIFSRRDGQVFALYRSATENVHRDVYLLSSADKGKSFRGSLLHKWEINACPMSSMDFVESGKETIAAWETGGQVYWSRVKSDPGAQSEPIAPEGEGKGRKHPHLAVNKNGDVLLLWTEGTGWQKGGSLAYQTFSLSGRPLSERKVLPGVPAWSFGGAVARSDGGFTIIY